MDGVTGGLFFEDLAIGQDAERAWTVSEAAIAAFAEVSGDHNPLHLDEAYAAASPFKGRVAHGMLTAGYVSAVIGGRLPGPGAIYISQTLNFLRPARIGDVVTVRVKITALDPAKGCATLAVNALVGRKAMLSGEAVVMVPRRAA